MNNIIVKVTDGELYNFFDSDTKNSFIIGSKRSCDLVVKSSLVAPEQLRCLCKDGVWYVEDLTPDGFKSEVLIGGKRFKRPIVKFDNEIIIRKEGDRKSKDFITISLVRKISRRRTGSKVDLSAKTVTVVGRNPSCDIVVDNPKVSERHFHIINDGKCCYIEDLHSINGTYVNNRKSVVQNSTTTTAFPFPRRRTRSTTKSCSSPLPPRVFRLTWREFARKCPTAIREAKLNSSATFRSE